MPSPALEKLYESIGIANVTNIMAGVYKLKREKIIHILGDNLR